MWNEYFLDDLLIYIYKNNGKISDLSALFFEDQLYVVEVIKKYKIFDELEQETINSQKWTTSIKL